MAALLFLTGALYIKLTLVNGVPAPVAAIPFVLFPVAGSIVLQVAIAAFSLKDAGASADERGTLFADKAGHMAAYILGMLHLPD